MVKKLVLQAVVNSLAFYAAALLIPDIKLSGIIVTVAAGTLLTLLNITLRPVLMILTSPIVLLTFGLFTLVVNTLMVMLTAGLIPGLSIPGFWLSLCVAVVIMLINLPLRYIYNSWIVVKS